MAAKTPLPTNKPPPLPVDKVNAVKLTVPAAKAWFDLPIIPKTSILELDGAVNNLWGTGGFNAATDLPTWTTSQIKLPKDASNNRSGTMVFLKDTGVKMPLFDTFIFAFPDPTPARISLQGAIATGWFPKTCIDSWADPNGSGNQVNASAKAVPVIDVVAFKNDLAEVLTQAQAAPTQIPAGTVSPTTPAIPAIDPALAAIQTVDEGNQASYATASAPGNALAGQLNSQLNSALQTQNTANIQAQATAHAESPTNQAILILGIIVIAIAGFAELRK